MSKPTLYCESQGHPVTDPGPDLRCPQDRSRLLPASGSVPVAPAARGLRPIRGLRIQFGETAVTVGPGERVLLGRDPEYAPRYAAELGGHDNLSRRHAELGLEPDGRAWIRDWYSTNQTRVNGEPLRPGGERDLRHGDTVRLCVGVSGTVILVREDSHGA